MSVPSSAVAGKLSSQTAAPTPSATSPGTLSRVNNAVETSRFVTMNGKKKGLFDMGKFASSFGSTSALSPVSAGADDESPDLDIDSWVEEGYTSSTLIFAGVEFKGVNIGSVALNEVETVEKNIAIILEKIEAVLPQLLDKLRSPGPNPYAVELFHIAKIDPRSPGMLTWAQNSDTLSSMKLRDNDCIKLSHEDEVTSIAVALPTLNENTVIEYTFDVCVKDIITRLKAIFPQLNSAKYGMFWQNRGVWLEDGKKMAGYVFSGKETQLELRELTEAFLLRVYIPDAETKFTIRALPTFRAMDAMRMITYQMANRGIQLESKRFGSGGQHGFFIPATGEWLHEEALLADYPNINQTEDLHFKLQYRHVKIITKWVRKVPKVLSSFLVGESVTVSVLEQMLSTEYGQFGASDYQIFYPNGDQAPIGDTIWDMIKESGEATLIYQSRPIPISVAAYGEPSNVLRFNESYNAPISSMLPRFARAFGLKQSLMDVPILEIQGVPVAVDVKKSLYEHNIDASTTVLYLNVTQKAMKAENSRSSLRATPDDLPIWDEPLEGTLQYEAVLSSSIPSGNELQTDASAGPNSLQVMGTPKLGFAGSLGNAQNSLGAANGPASLSMSQNKFASVQPATSGRVACGTLNRLIAHLASGNADGSVEYHDFVKTFLLTYQSFTTSATLLRKMIERYHVPRSADMTFDQFDSMRLQVQLRVCNVIMQWIKKYTSDFSGLNGVGLCAELYQFIEDVLVYDHPFMAKKLRKILNKLTEQNQLDGHSGIRKSQFGNNRFTHNSFVSYSASAIGGSANGPNNTFSILSAVQSPNSFLVPSTPGSTTPAPKYPKSEGDRHNIMAYPAEEIARQLTLQEFRMFLAIKPSEFLGQSWSKQDANFRSPNLLVLTRRFNAIASWVASVILDGRTPQNRAIRMAKFISVGSYLYQFNNFSTLMAIIAGINNSSIRRLKHTTKELPKSSARKLKELEIVMNAEASYKQYRNQLNAVTPPVIPYIGVVLMDLTFMEDGNPDKIDNKINFAKRALVADVIRGVEQQQTTGSYNFMAIEEFQAQLAKIPDNTDTREKELYAISLEREPRETPSNAASFASSQNAQSTASSPVKS